MISISAIPVIPVIPPLGELFPSTISVIPPPGQGPVLPVWIVVPLTVIAALVLAVHLTALPRTPMPASRRRIRLANGYLMLLTTPAAAFAFAFARPSAPRIFVMSWSLLAGLLGIVILLAALDVLNTARLQLRQRRELRAQIRSARRELLAAARTHLGTAHTSAAGAPASPNPAAEKGG